MAGGAAVFAAAISGVAPQPQPDVTVPAGGAARLGKRLRGGEQDTTDDVFVSEAEEPTETQTAETRGRHISEASEAGSEVSDAGTKRPRIKRLARCVHSEKHCDF